MNNQSRPLHFQAHFSSSFFLRKEALDGIIYSASEFPKNLVQIGWIVLRMRFEKKTLGKT